jgi:hypothetical protein
MHHGKPILDEEPPRDSARFNKVLTEGLDATSVMNADWITDAELSLDANL